MAALQDSPAHPLGVGTGLSLFSDLFVRPVDQNDPRSSF
jgi:hypothetical protein